MPDYKRLLHRKQIPEYFWEPGIIGGYRPPGISIKQSLQSVFSINNETFNVWTHLIALVFNLWYIQHVLATADIYNLPYEYKAPLLCFMVTSCIYPLGSAFAHTFNSISEFSQHCGFMVDYFGISTYAFGTALANLAYAFPPEWRNTTCERLFITVNFVSAFLAVCFSCRSRFRNFDICAKLWRFVGFFLPYLTSMTVLMYRVVSTSYLEDDAPNHYYNHFLCAFGICVFYLGHIPESFFPGTFDIYLHSHQIFHILVSLGTYQKLVGLQRDIATQYSTVLIPGCTQLMILLILVNACITAYYIYHKYHSIYTAANKCSNNGSSCGNTNQEQDVNHNLKNHNHDN